MPTNIDMDVLRTFVAGIDLGSFAKAASRLGRSPSAVSLQLRRLEEQAGTPLVRRQGRGLALTEAGETMAGYARRLLDLNDEALAAVSGPAIAGWVRLGLPQDLAEGWLPGLLARFVRLHPEVRCEARVDRNALLVEALARDDLDLALVWEPADAGTRGAVLPAVPMVWVGPRSGFVREPGEPVPLAAFAPPCLFRQAATEALDAAGIPWRVTFGSPSLSGLWAAVAAGLGVAPRTALGLPAALRVLDAASGLPALPVLSLALRTSSARPGPAVERLAGLMAEMLVPQA